MGIGSSGQVVGWLERMSLETSSSERGQKEEREGELGIVSVSVCGVENWPLIVVVLLIKNLAKSLAVRLDEGGGGGGQRREEKVLKSLRESEQLLILL